MTLSMLAACINFHASDDNLHTEKILQVGETFFNSVSQGDREKVTTALQSFENLFTDSQAMEDCYPVFINQCDRNGKSPLCHAVSKGNLPVACLLLQHGAQSNEHLIDFAKENGYSELEDVLIDANIDYTRLSKKIKIR